MGIRAQGNPIASFADLWSQTGTGAETIAGSPDTGMTATGGIISDYTSGSDVYRAHIFTASGTFDITDLGGLGTTVDYLVIAGGGGGSDQGSNRGGGGGAGGFRTNAPAPIAPGNHTTTVAYPVSTSPGSYTVTVGGGGAGSATNAGSDGNDSVFGTITSTGGGGGGQGSAGDPNNDGTGAIRFDNLDPDREGLVIIN